MTMTLEVGDRVHLIVSDNGCKGERSTFKAGRGITGKTAR
jgi:hypothetical protein